ncbi:hypothetical protein J4455_05135 [Candidatus Woesearchaeota archaeon]|nr:hypothetical protein [Candidatus Woesearchaeota archaeon]
MKKVKIAISMDQYLLDCIDNFMEKENISSRSHAIGMLLNKAVKYSPLSQAVLLIKEQHQKFLFQKFGDMTLIEHNLKFLTSNGINEVYLVTKLNDSLIESTANIQNSSKLQLIDEKDSKGTALALLLVKDQLKNTFLVMNADTFNNFNLKNMLKEHIRDDYLATVGLITSTESPNATNVVLDGRIIVDFRRGLVTGSNIINAGVYLFNYEIFDYFHEKTSSIEDDLIPGLVSLNRVQGIFTFGRFIHAPDKFVKVPLSDIIDRLSILKLKIERLGDESLKKEYDSYTFALNEYQKSGVEIKPNWFSDLYSVNKGIWDLEFDIRSGKEGKLGLEEVGRRAIAIRELNKQRVNIKNHIAETTGLGFKDIKVDHASG